MSQFALEITDLKKTYESGTVALKGINLTVTEGDFFAVSYTHLTLPTKRIV